MPPTPRPHGPKKKANVQLPSSRGRRLPLPLMLGAAGLVALVAVLGFLLLGGGGSSGGDAPKLLQAAGCSFQTVKSWRAGDHSVLSPQGTSKDWNTSPPTNGPHYQVPAIWGSYRDPLFPAQVVHNLEHGGIFILYGKAVSQGTIDQLQAFYDKHTTATLLAPLPSLGAKIALGAWVTKSASTPNVGVAHLAKCPRFDEKGFSAFFANYQFRGPERFPPSTLQPGT
jgi:Protein of unknown function (DUF3105)